MGTNEMTAMPPFLLRRREIPCRCSPVREVLRERFGDEAGRFRVVFSEGVVVIGDASGLFDYMALTLSDMRRGGRMRERRGGVGGMQPRFWEDNISSTSSLLLYFILVVKLDCPLSS
jgi:hypothetical protein